MKSTRQRVHFGFVLVLVTALWTTCAIAFAPWPAHPISTLGPATPFIYRPERTIARLQEIRGAARGGTGPHDVLDLTDRLAKTLARLMTR